MINKKLLRDWSKNKTLQEILIMCHIANASEEDVADTFGISLSLLHANGYYNDVDRETLGIRYQRQSPQIEDWLNNNGIDHSEDNYLTIPELIEKYKDIPDEYVPRFNVPGIFTGVRVDITEAELETLRTTFFNMPYA